MNMIRIIKAPFKGFLLLCFVINFSFVNGQTSQACSSFISCSECIINFQNSNCQWCTENGQCQNRGSTCSGDATKLVDPRSRQTTTTVKTSPKPFREEITKQDVIEVELRPGDLQAVSLEAHQPDNLPIEALFVQDISASMHNMLTTMSNTASQIALTLQEKAKNCPTTPNCAKFQLAVFVDKTWTLFNKNRLSLYVMRPGQRTETENDYHTGTFNDHSKFKDAVDSAKNMMGYSSGYEESNFEGIIYGVKNAKWTDGSRHLVFICTDTNSHISNVQASPYVNFSPDLTGGGKQRRDIGGRFSILRSHSNTHAPWNGPEHKHYGSDFDNYLKTLKGFGSKYNPPSLGMLKKSFLDKNIVPIVFEAASSNFGNKFWTSFVDGLGMGSPEPAPIDSKASNIVSVIDKAYTAMTSEININVVATNYNKLIKNINKFPFYQKLSGTGDFVKGIQVELLYDDPTSVPSNNNEIVPGAVTLSALGLSNVVINVKSTKCSCDEITFTDKAGTNQECNGCGVCRCKSGYTGEDCRCRASSAFTTCQPASNNLICSGVGQCHCGSCVCDPGYSGADCDCANGICVNNCGGPAQGECQCDGTCTCKNNYIGYDCTCNNNPSSITKCDTSQCEPPAGGGKCIIDDPKCKTEKCQCKPGYEGPNCQQRLCIPECQGGATCDTATGNCKCTGTNLDENLNCLCLKNGECPKDLVSGLECFGNGNCILDDTLQGQSPDLNCHRCECRPGYNGVACNCSTDFCQGQGPDGCHGNGTCTCGECLCNNGYGGENCGCLASDVANCPIFNNTVYPEDPANGEVCGGKDRGVCGNTIDNCGKCICDPQYAGDACDCIKQDCPLVNGNFCSGHGNCNGNPCGRCDCDADYIHDDCSCSLTSANAKCNGCNGNGVCDTNYPNCGTCICDTDVNGNPQFNGTQCECAMNLCPSVGNTKCGVNSEGYCTPCTNQCVCKPGFEQSTVSPELGCYCKTGTCPVGVNGKNCSGHGACTTCDSVCECDDNWNGEDCSYCTSSDSTTKNVQAGDTCNGNKVSKAGNCTEYNCPNVYCNQFKDCQQCQDDEQCSWCGEKQDNPCTTNDDAQKNCDPGRINESCDPAAFNVAPIAAGVAGGLVGLFLLGALLYKLITTALDKKEWAAFEKESAKNRMVYTSNPMGTQSSTEVMNPIAEEN